MSASPHAQVYPPQIEHTVHYVNTIFLSELCPRLELSAFPRSAHPSLHEQTPVDLPANLFLPHLEHRAVFPSFCSHPLSLWPRRARWYCFCLAIMLLVHGRSSQSPVLCQAHGGSPASVCVCVNRESPKEGAQSSSLSHLHLSQ